MKKEDCPLCPKVYQSRNDLIGHLVKIHGVDKIEAQSFLLRREQERKTGEVFEGAILYHNGVRMNGSI